MYRKALNYLRGQAVVRITCETPERVVNLCAAHGVPFWDLTWETAAAFRVTTTLPGVRRLREVTADIGAEVTVVRKSGAPELWRRGHRRYVLLAAGLVLPLLLAVGSAFIWEFQVTGNDTVPTEEILQALERCGVGVGSRGIGLDQDDLRNRALSLLPDVVYLAVNVRGCTAHVQVVERTRPPHLYRDSDVQNVIAEKDGLITRIEALDGVTCTAVGEVVQAGQVLLSGVADSPRGYRCLRATGRIWARTWYEWTVPIPLRTEVKTGEADSCTRLWLDMGRQRIKLCGGGSVLEGNCDKITEYRRLRLPFGVQTPVTLAVERTVRHTAYAGERPEAEARAEGERQLLAQLEQTIGEDGRILRRETLERRQGAYLLVTLRAECEEQIGADAPLRIITSDTGR